MSLLDLLKLQRTEAEERLNNPSLSSDLREADETYLAELDRLIAKASPRIG